ncbi:type I pantothenate kinase [Thalassobacillus sp. C254]|uniref:type I pantothenate kinase n=1 Tax=Thalassobacillus sp. C254 TaxID=1225341 RepID=UPI0006D1D9BF|nr:type I pantothenate kinase [Thalassobacillus sp. C254]
MLKNPHMITPYTTFTRQEWSQLKNNATLPLSESEIENMQGLNEVMTPQEVIDIYLPLSRLLSLHATASQDLHKATNSFLHSEVKKVPFIIGIAGSVAVGKSTIARVLKALLSLWPNHPTVDLVTTDGFLYSNATLIEKGLMNKKGFPESYNVSELLHFLSNIKSGINEIDAPMYSHVTYDIVPFQKQKIKQPDIVIIEGINVLQPPTKEDLGKVHVSDFFDFSIYIDAKEEDIFSWYVERFKLLRETSFQNPNSYFHMYADLSEDEAVRTAEGIWNSINKPNLNENILPTRNRADLILHKGSEHLVTTLEMRKI